MTEKRYTHEKKKRIAKKIEKIGKRNKKEIVKIYEIIQNDKKVQEQKLMTKNDNGYWMFFHKLEDTTYAKIELELANIYNRSSPIGSDTIDDYKPYVQEEFPSQKGMAQRFKYSNKEKTLMKRQMYADKISMDNKSDVIYTVFDVTSLTDSEK